MPKFYLTVENDQNETLLEITAPTFEILSEKVGAWERSRDEEAEAEYNYNAQQ